MRKLEDWKSTLSMHPTLMEFLDPDREDQEMVSQVFRACVEPDTGDFTSSGIFGVNDPRAADPEEAKTRFEEKVSFLVDFIRIWKTIPVPPAFED
jgi:creatinine amidohydrolase/Fe(II)-dependent formamide hydrolase-like protein